MPRKSKLNDAVQNRICEGLKLGMTYKAAALSAGIDQTTFWRWHREGKKARNGVKRAFYLSVEKSVAESQKVLLGIVLKGAKEKNPRLALELLSRRWPEAYAPKATIENRHSGPDGKSPIKLVTALSVVDDATLEALAYGGTEADDEGEGSANEG